MSPNYLSELATILAKLLNNQKLSFVFRQERPDFWEDGVKGLDYCPVSLMPVMIDYQLAYAASFGNNAALDLSLILLQDGKPCGLWSISLVQKDSEVTLASNGGPLDGPKLFSSMGRRQSADINKKCVAVVTEFNARLKQTNLTSIQAFNASDAQISDWQDIFLRKGADVRLEYDLFLDLKPDVTAIKSRLRDSYKSLINVGYKTWSVCVLDENSPSIWSEFKGLHLAVAGRNTRSETTWRLQLEAINQGKAFLVYLRDSQDKMIGGGLFYYSQDESLYAVGAYDRDLFDKPVGHVVQFHAVSLLKEKGVRWHKLGAQLYQSTIPTPSPKELAISDFKRGFSSHIFPRYVINYQI